MTSSVRPLAVDEQVGEYKILGTAGVGGMGIVYKALDLKLNRTVALKFLPNELNVASKDKERFLQEARTASALDHSNIGVIHGLEQTADGQTFIVMAYYEGLTLAEKIRRGPLPPKEAVEIMVQLVHGLSEAHEHSIIHRDIKPSNVILTRQNVAKIVDFGLARVASNAATTLTAGPVGTLAYMSPEQIRNEPLDRRTDIWVHAKSESFVAGFEARAGTRFLDASSSNTGRPRSARSRGVGGFSSTVAGDFFADSFGTAAGRGAFVSRRWWRRKAYRCVAVRQHWK